MFENIGSKIKSLATIICVIGIGFSVICGVYLISHDDYYNDTATVGWIVLIAGSLSSWIGSFGMYGFGELVEKTSENNAALTRIEELLKKQPARIEVHPETHGESERKEAKDGSAVKGETPESKKNDIEYKPVKERTIQAEEKEGIEACKSAAEVMSFMKQLVQNEESNSHITAFMELMNEYMVRESKGEDCRSSAVNLAKGFIKGNMQLYQMDRSQPKAACPVCDTMQNSKRNICLKCGVVFHDFE